jgi:hypothetical protein
MRRHRDQKLLDRARPQANTKQAKLDRKHRQHLMERSFADASNLHGFKSNVLVGEDYQTIDPRSSDCDCSNLRKLIGAIQNAPQSAWKPLIRTLSELYMMLGTCLAGFGPVPSSLFWHPDLAVVAEDHVPLTRLVWRAAESRGDTPAATLADGNRPAF